LYFTIFTVALICFNLAGSEVVLSLVLAVDKKRVSAIKTATVLGRFVEANKLLPPGLNMSVPCVRDMYVKIGYILRKMVTDMHWN
jgi:hypothetical protein